MSDKQRTFRLSKSEPCCPECQSLLDAATSVSGGKGGPTPGTITICSYCATILQFTDSMQLVHVPDSFIESLDLKDQLQLKQMQQTCLRFILERNISARLPRKQ